MKENKLSLCYDFFRTASRKERRTMADELKKIQEKLDKIYSLLAIKTIATEFSSPQSAKTPDASVRSSRPSVSASGAETNRGTNARRVFDL
jgi:hypothetical protein